MINDQQLGLSVNGSMTEIEDGVVTTGALRFEIAGQPDVTIEFNQDSRAEMEYKSNVLIFRGNNMVNLTAQVTNVCEYRVLFLWISAGHFSVPSTFNRVTSS